MALCRPATLRVSSWKIAPPRAAARASSMAGVNASLPGRMMASTPAKPSSTAMMRRGSSGSFSMGTARSAMITGMVRFRAVSSATGMSISAMKYRIGAMPMVRPRNRCVRDQDLRASSHSPARRSRPYITAMIIRLRTHRMAGSEWSAARCFMTMSVPAMKAVPAPMHRMARAGECCSLPDMSAARFRCDARGRCAAPGRGRRRRW